MQIVTNLSQIKIPEGASLRPETLKKMQEALDWRLKHHSLYPKVFTSRGAVGQYAFPGKRQVYNEQTGLIDTIPGFHDVKDAPCHGALFKSINKDTDGLINFHMNNFWPQKDEKFLWWLIKDMYTDMNDNIAVVVDHSEVKNFPVAVVLLDTKKQDIVYFGSFLIATRSVSQWHCAPVWSRLCNFGFTPELAWLLSLTMGWDCRSNYAGKDYVGALSYRNTYAGDQPFNPRVSLGLLEKREYVKLSEGLRNLSGGYKGGQCNFIWEAGARDSYNILTIAEKLIPMVKNNTPDEDYITSVIKFYNKRG